MTDIAVFPSYVKNIVTYLFKHRSMEAEKRPLLGNGLYTRSTRTRHVSCDISQQLKRRCNRRLLGSSQLSLLRNCAVELNQHATIDKAVFSVVRLRLYNEDLTQLELEMSRDATEI
jgi:plasmid stability protein